MIGVHHQTVERCVERALAYGPVAALDDRPRPGSKRTITPEAKAWLVSLACDKAKDHGHPHELTTRCWRAMHARIDRPSDRSVSPIWRRERYARSSARRKSSRTRFGIIWNVAMPSSSRRWPKFCVFIARSKFCKRPPSARQRASPWRSRPLQRPRPDLPPKPGVYPTFARDHEYKRHRTLSQRSLAL